MTHALQYTTTDINRNFKIKVSGMNNGQKLHTLVGVRGLLALVGEDLANKLLTRAFNSAGDREVCKLRRGLKITFYYQ